MALLKQQVIRIIQACDERRWMILYYGGALFQVAGGCWLGELNEEKEFTREWNGECRMAVAK